MREITEEEKVSIQAFGALQYGSAEMFTILGWPESDFFAHLECDGEFNRVYERGRVMSLFKIDISLLTAAQEGDLKALEFLDKRIKFRIDEDQRQAQAQA